MKKSEKAAEIPKPNKNFDLYKAIRGIKQGDVPGESSLYKSTLGKRNVRARKWVTENLQPGSRSKIFPGQMIMFRYMQPKTEEELEYYDAAPCTIFFGLFNSKGGPRVVGWNLHYYPTRIRFRVLSKLFELFRGDYIKAWSDPLSGALSGFDYKSLMSALRVAGLDFGIREYIPELMKDVIPIPPSAFQKVVFTEGQFMKKTRENIMTYWKNKAANALKNL